MALISQDLIDKLQARLGLSKPAVYSRIQKVVSQTNLDRDLAAIVLAGRAGLSMAKYATTGQLARIRGLHAATTMPVEASSRKGKDAPELEASPIKLDLSSIRSSELRRLLQRDIAELNSARSQGYSKTAKTCMVIAGSIVEALLLNAIKGKKKRALAAANSLPNPPPSDPEKWELSQMVSVATAMSPPLLPADAEAGATQVRQWRNLIHPGRELRDSRRSGIWPTAARAQSSVAFLQFVAEQLGQVGRKPA